jgi:ribosomal protein L16 Arg81 hydroxylase
VNPEVLTALLGADALDTFLSDYWPNRVFVSEGDRERLPAALLDAELNEFDALSRRYKGVVSFFGDDRSGHMVPVEGIEASAPYRCGLSVYLTDVAPYFPDIQQMVKQLEFELGVNEGCARAGVFASPADGGISCHYDTVDIFSIQLRGNKKFDVAPVSGLPHPLGSQYMSGSKPMDDHYPQATDGFPDWEGAEFRTVEMTPGTVLYMPRGTWHRTEAEGDSIAVSIGMEPPSAAESVLEQLRLLLLQDPEWRRPLYGAWGAGKMVDSAAERAEELLAGLPALAAALTPDLVASPKLSEARRIAMMNAASRVQHTPNSRLIIGEPPPGSDDDSILASVEIYDRSVNQIMAEIEMPSRCEPVLRWLEAQRGSFLVSDVAAKFPELTEDQHLQLLQTLASAGLLRVYWFPKLKKSVSEKSGSETEIN